MATAGLHVLVAGFQNNVFIIENRDGDIVQRKLGRFSHRAVEGVDYNFDVVWILWSVV